MTDVSVWDQSTVPWVLRGQIPGDRFDFSGFADLATLKADGTVGDGTGWLPYPFGPQSYVTLGDAAIARWDGSTWTVAAAPQSLPPPGSSDPPSGTPSTSWTKAQIIAWLAGEGITLDAKARSTLSKAELLDLVADVLDDEVDLSVADAPTDDAEQGTDGD